MDKDIVVVCIEGFSASSRPDKKTLSAVLAKYVQKHKESVFDYKEADSSSFNCVADCGDFISARCYPGTNLLLVGKSLGGVKLYRLLKRWWETIDKYNKVVCLFIDAHSPFPTFIGNFRNLKLRKKWIKPCRVYLNVYQKESYPKGAKIKRVSKGVRLFENTNHWNIINAKETNELIEESFNYLRIV